MSDFTTRNIRVKATERYSYGWTDPRGVSLSPISHQTPAQFYLGHSQWRLEYDAELKLAKAARDA